MPRRRILATAAVALVTTALFGAAAGQGAQSVAAAASPATAIENVPATAIYGLHDSAGHTMDTVKVVADPTTPGRYLGVYHWCALSTCSVGVATSTNLRNWTYIRTLDGAASQPYLAFSPAPKNGPILAEETYVDPHLRFKYWTSVSNFLGTTAAYATFDAPRTLSKCAEGTPDITSVGYASSTSTIRSGSTIRVSHHYFAGCNTDREATGTLTNFGKWTTAALPSVDAALTAAGAVGKHGDRDTFSYLGNQYQLFEGNITTASPMADWRPFLYDGTTATRLNIHTAKGSSSFANPSVTTLNDPAGVPSLLVSMFLPSEGVAAGESAGELLYWKPIASPQPPAGTPTPTNTSSSTPTLSSTPTSSPTPTLSSTPTSSPTPALSSTPTSSPTSTVSASPNPTAPPGSKVTKILTFIEENHSLTQMQAGMPYLYSLAKQYAYASAYTAITHPSEPNYVAIAFGDTMGDTSDHGSGQSYAGPTVFGQAVTAGKTARVYQESMAGNCQPSTSSPYYTKHNPWAQAGTERSACAAGDVPLGTPNSGALASDISAGTLPNAGFVTPNINNDAHDGTLGTADTWLKGWLPSILAGPDFTSGRLAVVVTADEDNRSSGNTVLTVVLHPSLNGDHLVVTKPLTHYSLTRLYDEIDGTPYLRNAATAPDMRSAFTLP